MTPHVSVSNVVPTQINWTSKKIETVVDYVKRPTDGET